MKKPLLAILILSCFYSVVFGAASDYAGVYRGTITGDDYGPWMGVVDATGRTKMLFYSNIYQTMDGSQGYYVNNYGTLSAISLVNRSAFSVSFTMGGNVSGTWASPNYATGTISGSKQTNNSIYAGTYTGTISGSDSGSWTIVIDSSGLISGSGVSQYVGSFSVDGAVDNTGFFMGITDDSAAYGKISGNSLSGSWFDDGVFYGGTFNGSKQMDSYTYYRDNDNDGYGNLNISTQAAYQPSGYVTNHLDCNDYDSTIHPGATEIRGDGIDQDYNSSDLPELYDSLTQTQVSQLYVSIFGRASEGEGNSYWQTLELDMATTADVMLVTDAARNYFGANLNTNQAFIEHIYLNTLNKTIADDFDGISYWVSMLDAGTSRGQAVATLVGAINDYAPDGPYYNPDDTATVAAYNQFMNRVEISNYMADTVYATPDDWETSTSFSHDMVVTDDHGTVSSTKANVDLFR